MNVQQQKQQKGFTIIEVVLVLAIAALIFLMVFLALPALQRGQRDTARKNDISIVSSAVTDYTSNNNGTFPSAATYTNDQTGFGKYIFAGNKTVSGNTSNVVVQGSRSGTGGQTDAQIEVWLGGKCGSNGSVDQGSARSIALTTKLEAGNGQAFCQNS